VPILWTFRCYVSSRGVDEIRAAYDAASKKVRARFLARLQMLAQLPPDEWHSSYYKKLSGECEGLWEIRFEADNVPQRPLGYRSGALEFTLLLWARERNDRFIPVNACEQALHRKAECLAFGDRTNAFWLPLE